MSNRRKVNSSGINRTDTHVGKHLFHTGFLIVALEIVAALDRMRKGSGGRD